MRPDRQAACRSGLVGGGRQADGDPERPRGWRSVDDGAEQIPIFLRGIARRYQRLADDVGGVAVDRLSEQEQRAWATLYTLASRRVAHLRRLAADLTSPYGDVAAEVTNGIAGIVEDVQAAALNDDLGALRRP